MKQILVSACLLLGQDPKPEAIVFVSTGSMAESIKLLKSLKGKEFRVVLLVEDFSKLAQDLDRPQMFELAELARCELALWDAEGLEWARKLGIKLVPAVAVFRGNRWHVASGTEAEVFSPCK